MKLEKNIVPGKLKCPRCGKIIILKKVRFCPKCGMILPMMK